MNAWQCTLQEKITVTGIGLHTGCPIALEMLPAPVDSGIVFVRADLPGAPQVPADVHHLVDTTLATSLGAPLPGGGQATVSTVEHLLAAMMSLGVDNARILVRGPEVPVMDGSAAPWVAAIEAVGIEAQRRRRRYLRLRREVVVRDGNKLAALSPGPGLRIHCALDYDHPLIGAAPYAYDASPERFRHDIAPARTFCFGAEVDSLRARGLALGGSLDNAIVIDAYQVLNPEGLRFADEFVRHKVLDAVGDLALCGHPVWGRLQLHCSGHALNTALVRATLADSRNYELVVPDLEAASLPLATGRRGRGRGDLCVAKGMA